MNEQTEKLRGIIEGYLKSPVNTFKPTHILSRQILEACKEAGLKFVPNELNIGGAINTYRDISFRMAVVFDEGKFASRDAIKLQIKEIDE